MRKFLLLVGFSLLSLAQPARAQFCPGVSPWVFDDVLASDPFCGNITWMAQNGITLGCGVIDANHRLYCPFDAVSRIHMAVFLNRLGNVRVEAVGTGPGLTGGPITGIGTINLAATNLLPTTACANNQIARWNGSAWVCSIDANSGGTVTSVGSGTGLTGGPVTSSGALSIATGFQLPQGCGNGQVAKSNGAGSWTCASDATGTGTVTGVTAGAGLTGGTITTSGTIAVDPASTTLTGSFFRHNGNAFGTTAVLGTTDGNALDVRVGNSRAMRIEPNAVSPNVVGGAPVNLAGAGVRGVFVGGGGAAPGADPYFNDEAPNQATDSYGAIGGGYGNTVGNANGDPMDASGATVAGGVWNNATLKFSTVGGGERNVAGYPHSVVAGGYKNGANQSMATVGGGGMNVAGGDLSTVAGGANNSAGNQGSTVGGGTDNIVSGLKATIGGGYQNQAIGGYSAVGSGSGNIASGDYSTIAGGFNNQAIGIDSTVIGGETNVASGILSVAAGFRAQANADGCFVFGDYSTGNTISCNAANRFVARALGGVFFFAGGNTQATYTGVVLPPGATAWVAGSDRNTKENVTAVEPRDVLERVAAMPISTWNLKAQDASIRHMGPMAQDFRAAFGLGETELGISTIDADGVALAAIQGLNAKLEAQLKERDAQIAELRRLVEVLLARTSPEGRVAAK